MTPAEHYREAERLTTWAMRLPMTRDERGLSERMLSLSAAQVHATLANAHMTAGVWKEES